MLKHLKTLIVLGLVFLTQYHSSKIFAQQPKIQLNCASTEGQVKQKIPQPTPDELAAYRALYPPCSDPNATKIVRVNLHFILDDMGEKNFQEFADGYGNIHYDGYKFGEEVITKCNREWAGQDNGTYGAWLYNGTANRFLPMRVRLQLTGIYFHRDSYWNANPDFLNNWAINTLYGVNTWNTVNVYVLSDPAHGGAACAVGPGGLCAVNGGSFVKLVNPWHIYSQYPGWASTYTAHLLNHELGHIFGLRHDWYFNIPLDWGDGCQDTPEHPNCWDIQECGGSWAAQSNNMMSYSQYDPALTPCQIQKIHDTLNMSMSNYVQSCGSCVPAHAFVNMADTFCAYPDYRGGYKRASVALDARASFNETAYWIQIYEVANPSSTAIVGNHFTQQYSGQAGYIDLSSFCNYNFQVGKHYRIRLVLSNGDCLPTSEFVKTISIVPCQHTVIPIDPRPKSIHLAPQGKNSYVIWSEEKSTANIAIQDMLGRVLYQSTNITLEKGENTLDLSGFIDLKNQQVYILSVQTQDEIKSVKFIKN